MVSIHKALRTVFDFINKLFLYFILMKFRLTYVLKELSVSRITQFPVELMSSTKPYGIP